MLGERWYGGETLLHFLTVERDYENVRFLASLGADINAMNPDGGTPLHSAVLGNDSKGISILLELGADPSLRNGSGCNALEWAEFVDADVCIRDLLRKAAGKRRCF